MTPDESEIRAVVARWMEATKAGDTETILSLMTDDVVFLVPGREPMRKPEFANAAASQSGTQAPAIEGRSDVQEVTVVGDWAFMWSKLRVTVTPKTGAAPTIRSGHTLSVFRKLGGKWLLARDANLLTTESKAG
jgi:uncharacterized protein (TIGR02246 family)